MTHRLGFSGRGKVNKLNLAGQIVLRKQLARLCLLAGLHCLQLAIYYVCLNYKAFVHLITGYYGRKYCWTKYYRRPPHWPPQAIGKFYPIWEFICKHFKISVTLRMSGELCKFLPRVEKGSTNISMLYCKVKVRIFLC